jgi:hypothetical protein
VRGVVALEVLARIEQVLRDESGEPGLVLGDWFDYVGGTSTGAIIAGGVAMGLPVHLIQQLYRENMHSIVDRAGIFDLLRARYDEAGIETVLRREFGEERTLGSADLRCLLLLGLRNSTTGSPWPVSSNPDARFNLGSGSNLDLPLWQLVRASSAAPTFFVPEDVVVGGHTFVFSDGAVTTLNNPALQLALMATLPAYNLGWPTGRDELLLVSVGTGTSERARPDLRADDLTLLSYATAVPEALIHSVAVQNDLLCRVLGECRAGPPNRLRGRRPGRWRRAVARAPLQLCAVRRRDPPGQPRAAGCLAFERAGPRPHRRGRGHRGDVRVRPRRRGPGRPGALQGIRLGHALGTGAMGVHRVDHGAQHHQQRPGQRLEGSPFTCQREPLDRPVHQRDTEGLLEPEDAGAERRLGHVHGPGGRREAVVVDELDKGRDLSDVEPEQPRTLQPGPV